MGLTKSNDVSCANYKSDYVQSTQGGCLKGEDHNSRPLLFKDFAMTTGSVGGKHTDKIEGLYSTMYGILLLPVLERAKALGKSYKKRQLFLF